MLWLATFLTLSALFATAIGVKDSAVRRVLYGEELQRYKKELVQGLPDGVTKSVMDELHALPYEQMKKVHAVCCKEDSGCDADAVAFVVMEYKKFTQADVGLFATHFKVYLLSRVEDSSDLRLDHDCFERLDGALLLESFGQWYKNAGYAIKDEEAFKKAFSDAIFSIDDPYAKRLRVELLFRLVGQPVSEAQLVYWMKQPENILLEVYLCLPNGGNYKDLLILQPIVFDTEFIRTGAFTDESYRVEFMTYIEFIAIPDGLKLFNEKYLPGLNISRVLEALRRMAKGMKEEDLGTHEKELLQVLKEKWNVPAELRFKVAAYFPGTSPSFAQDALFDKNNRGSWGALDYQLWKLWGPGCVESMNSYAHFFPLAQVIKYHEERGTTLIDNVEQYEAAVTKMLQELLQMETASWKLVEPKLREDLRVDTFWKLFAFLKDRPQYGGFFGEMFRWNNDSWNRKELDGVAPEGLEVLIQGIITASAGESRYEKLVSFAERIMVKDLKGDHPYFEARFELARKQFRDKLSKSFKDSQFVASSLHREILSILADTNESGGLHDLQVALVVARMKGWYESNMSDADSKLLEERLKGYNTGQLGNIHKSDLHVYLLLKYSQLREFDSDLFEFNRPVSEARIFTLLSKVCRQAHSDRDSIFGLVLDGLSQRLGSEWPFCEARRAIAEAFLAFPFDQDLLSNSGRYWMELEERVCVEFSPDDRSKVVAELGPKLTSEPLAIPSQDVTEHCSTLDELFENMAKLGKTQ